MPLDRILLLAQLAALPVMVCAGWLAYGAWRQRNRVVFATSGLVLLLAGGLLVALQTGALSAIRVARLLPTSVLSMRARDPGLGTINAPEVRVLCERLSRGELRAGELELLLAPPTLPTQPAYVLSAAQAIGSPQSQALVAWLNDPLCTSTFESARAVIAIISAVAVEPSADPRLTAALARRLDTDHSENLSLQTKLLDAVCFRSLGRGGPHPAILPAWGRQMLRFTRIAYPKDASKDAGLLDIDPRPPHELRLTPAWSIRVTTADSAPPSESRQDPPPAPGTVRLALTPSPDNSNLLTGDVLEVATLDRQSICELWLAMPGLFPEDFDPKLVPRCSVWRRTRITMDLTTPNTYHSEIIAEGVDP